MGRATLAASPAPGRSITIGIDRAGATVELSDAQLAAHSLIVGATGSGKTTTLLRLLTEQVYRGAPVVAMDLKGSPAFAARLEQASSEAGGPFRLWTLDGPSHWNPLQHGNATELKDKLIGSERFTEPHYQRAAERYLQLALRVLEHSSGPAGPSLEQVVELLDPRRLKGALREVPTPLKERIQDYLAELPHDQVSAARGLQTRLATLAESHTGQYLQPGGDARGASIDLRRALSEPGVVVFSLNSSRYPELAAQIGTLVIQDVIAASGQRLADGTGPQAYVGVDEFSAIGADHIVALIARGREAGFGTLVGTQEFVDLDRAAPGLRDQVIGNTSVKIIHRQEVPASAKLVAEMIGTERVWEETRQFGGTWTAGYDTGRGTRHQVERFIVDPNEIMRLAPGEAVAITKIPQADVRVARIAPPRSLEPGGRDRTPAESARPLDERGAVPERPRTGAPERMRGPGGGRPGPGRRNAEHAPQQADRDARANRGISL